MSRPAPATWIATIVLVLSATSVSAQDESPRRLTGSVSGSFDPVKIAVPTPHGGPGAEIAETVRSDLEFSGFFDVVDPSLYRLVPATDGAPRHEDWVSIGADALVRTVARVTDGRVDIEARLFDNASGELLFARRYGGPETLRRRVAHQLSDDLVRHYTGRPGVALTRISFVSTHGAGKEIYLMDYDGQRLRRLTTSNTLNLSPAWSPDGDELAFVSWHQRQPGVFLMSSEGEMRELSTVGGELSAAPDWAPDGQRLVYSSDVHGNTELYVLQRRTGENRRLTFNPAIDTAPAFSPNGREIAFTSDRTGSPQIYVMDADGVNVRRVSWRGSYNDSAAWSPNGDLLAYVSRVDGRFQVVVLDVGSGEMTQITRGAHNNENPRWSPDGRHLVFASDRAGSYAIFTIRSDGADVRRLTRGRDSFTPDWSR